MTKRAVIYARLSIATEESVSIERQVESATNYARARGWEVVGTFKDKGVSATRNRPEDRKGWSALLTSAQPFDVVVVWKVDRLARRVLDFLNANEAVKARGAGIVAVEDPIDMTTAQGEAFATMLAVFGQMEAATMSARSRAARNYLLTHGRWAGGLLPYGYRQAPNPAGVGFVVAQDPGEIEHVRAMVERTRSGRTIYSTVKWLNETGVETRKVKQARVEAAQALKEGKEPKPIPDNVWAYNTVDRLMRHPMLAGTVPHNPGHDDPHRRRGENVVRGDNGLPVVYDDLAVMTLQEWRTMQAKLNAPNDRRKPRAMRRKHSGVLSGLLWCGDERHDEPVRMYRGTVGSGSGPRPSYQCPDCYQTLSNADDLIIRTWLEKVGGEPWFAELEEIQEGGSATYTEATLRIGELGAELANASPARMAEIMAEISRLKEVQEEARGVPDAVILRSVGDDRTFGEFWAKAQDDEARRKLLGQSLDRIIVHRGGAGAWTDAAKLARLEWVWHPGIVSELDGDETP